MGSLDYRKYNLHTIFPQFYEAHLFHICTSLKLESILKLSARHSHDVVAIACPCVTLSSSFTVSTSNASVAWLVNCHLKYLQKDFTTIWQWNANLLHIQKISLGGKSLKQLGALFKEVLNHCCCWWKENNIFVRKEHWWCEIKKDYEEVLGIP